ncbi:hypothetical protein HYW72_00540 [Candidatus Nomurabacteria bacterium]|nr:hypothetical protein [Candidatus Nomurabacteria bacterium]
MKKAVKIKKITIDTLAIMVAKGFENTATTNDIKNIDKKLDQHDKIFELMIKELRAIHEDNKYFRENILNVNADSLSYDRKINNLTVRVEKLELNAK